MRNYAFLVLIMISAGCEKPEQKQVVQPKRDQDQSVQANADSRVQELSAQLDQMRIENQRLKAKNDVLANQNKDMQPRLQQLIAGYGTGIWGYTEDSDYPVFVKPMKGAAVREIIAELNSRFQRSNHPKIELKKKEAGTVFIGVDNDEQLGQQMGSSGALSYMTSVVYSLTSVKGIDCVSFDIEEGDHAGPGKYCKDSLEPLPQQ